ncbi:BadM/Rrf2 family transcriptional regulator [Lachnotalea glycerini]|uniref:Rrf2 family transcriptional regulator n=1 Tax=Lachnotalea glycerini TaxID=1763509 RepID=A0A255INK2_9FIRM|nr:Rrf2 family transcriptional regulator [Lachnotalea glycerini]OYP54360.1 Rrf2 family transcriptional regulator [Lachnotalea glycerini]PXV96059.1 BadM/Rrf2 family transcriptional regulator [Lachnotalea glycerini]RDY30592.1 Rrf2 family transcriptional regulator [Lachnotalea glycerini]
MKISTKGRYAIRVMIDLAEHNNGQFITLMDIAQRQEISEKYLEAIVSILSKNNLLVSLRGKGGGYKLAKTPDQYTIKTILMLTEGPLAPVSCLANKPNGCLRATECKTLKMWEGLEQVINDYLENITVADLLDARNDSDYYVI